MVQLHDPDIALGFSEIDSLQLVASGRHQTIPINHRHRLLSLGLIQPHNLFFPFILTEAGRQRLEHEESLLRTRPVPSNIPDNMASNDNRR